MRIIVCGTRTFADGELLFRTLDRLTRQLRKVTVVSGRAPGADLLGEAWAKARGHKFVAKQLPDLAGNGMIAL